jgi:hypothetical protein
MRSFTEDARICDARQLVASVARGATPEWVVCLGRCVSRAAGCLVPTVTVTTEPDGVRSLRAVAVSVCEQDGDENVGQPVLVGVWAAA